MFAPLALIPLFLLPSPYRHAADHLVRHRWGVWTLETRTSLFTGERRCRLFGDRLDYQRGAVVIHLPRRVDTSAAVYRVDAGEPVDVRTETMDMARAGFVLYRDDLANPSGGLVRIPKARLLTANSVWIQSGPRGIVLKVKTAGLAKALDKAKAAGCTEDTLIPLPR